MTATKLDQIARAIYETFENRPLYAKRQMNTILAEELARAAVEAMREPAECQDAPWRDEMWKYVDEGAQPADLWRIGIDSILTEGQQT